MTSSSVREGLPSKKGEARSAEGQDLPEEGGMILFQQGDCSFTYVHSRGLKAGRPPWKPEAIGAPTSSSGGSPSAARPLLPLQAVGLGIGKALPLCPSPLLCTPPACSCFIFLPFMADTNRGGQKGGCLIRITWTWHERLRGILGREICDSPFPSSLLSPFSSRTEAQ